MPVHHVKGQPGASMYVRKKGRFTFYTNCETPCSIELLAPAVVVWRTFAYLRRSGGSDLEDICLIVAVVVWRTFA